MNTRIADKIFDSVAEPIDKYIRLPVNNIVYNPIGDVNWIVLHNVHNRVESVVYFKNFLIRDTTVGSMVEQFVWEFTKTENSETI